MRSFIFALLLGLAACTNPISDWLVSKAYPPVVNKVGEVTIQGMLNEKVEEKFTQELKVLRNDPSVKAILVTMDTPGGELTVASNMEEELEKVKVPVVVWCNHLCVSGGYYIITANSVKFVAIRRETIIGDVGIIAMYQDLPKDPSVHVFVTGNHKVIGAAHPMTKEEEAYVKQDVAKAAARFFARVKAARPNLSSAVWAQVQEGDTWSGAEAVSAGIPDAVMTYEQAYEKAARLGGL